MTIRFNTQLNAGQLRLVLRLSTTFLTRVPQNRTTATLVLELVLVGPLDRPLPDHFFEQVSEHPKPEHAPESSSRLTQRAFRGNTQPDDVDRLLSLSLPEDSWNDRLRSALVGILMSPRFLLIAEGSTGTPKQIDDQELATKLASFLWNGLPDDPLLREVEKGTLRKKRSCSEPSRMLKDPRLDPLLRVRFAVAAP